jgi:hypothetical protein
MNEPPHEFARVIDPLTHGIIYCVNRTHLKKPGWVDRFLGKQVPIIDVTQQKPCNNSMSFTHDSFVDAKNVKKFLKIMIDYACLMHKHLVKFGSVVVHCKNGRSRSPTVILAFFMLRGIPLQSATQFLIKAFHSQRPTIAKSSASFPNFPKFDNVILSLGNSLQQEWLISRVCSNFHPFFPVSESTSSAQFTPTQCSNMSWKCERCNRQYDPSNSVLKRCLSCNMKFSSSVVICKTMPSISIKHPSTNLALVESFHLHGEPWTAPLIIPKQWKGKLPASSFCLEMETERREDYLHGNQRTVRKRRKVQKLLPPNPNVHTIGRRVKICVPSAESKYELGNLLMKVETNWIVYMDDGTEKTINEKDILSAFPVGERVVVNWGFEGQFFHGVVVDWDGGTHYSVFYDGEKRPYRTFGDEMKLSSKPLLNNCHPKVRRVIKNVRSSSSSSSRSSSAQMEEVSETNSLQAKDDAIIQPDFERELTFPNGKDFNSANERNSRSSSSSDDGIPEPLTMKESLKLVKPSCFEDITPLLGLKRRTTVNYTDPVGGRYTWTIIGGSSFKEDGSISKERKIFYRNENKGKAYNFESKILFIDVVVVVVHSYS